FFQAEYGIRARAVTGVQTCALPIFHRGPLAFLLGGHIVPTAAVPQSARGRPPVARARVTTHSDALSECGGAAAPPPASPHRSPEIGRASCRASVHVTVGAVDSH